MKIFSMLSACLAASVLLSLPAAAQYTGPGAQPVITSLKSVLDKPVDDQRVVLRGKLVKQISSDKYLFSDGKQEIRVEIDDKIFPAVPVDANTNVELVGEVEKDFLESPEIDVEAVRILR